jgi:hypothetical protein
LSVADIQSGTVGRVIGFSRQLRNLHWLGVEAEVGMDAQLAERLRTREQLLALGLQKVAGTGGRFRQRPLWRSSVSSSTLIDTEILRLRPQLDEAVADLFLRSETPRVMI